MSEAKVVRLFPKIHNLKPFLIKDHPEYHPESKDYSDYWNEQERRCVEGYWGLDKDEVTQEGGWRYGTPQLYWYSTFCPIEQEDPISNSIRIDLPLLRDVEWLFFYNWLICRGFSGFDGDEEYSCNNILRKIETGELLTTKDKIQLKNFKHIYKKDGSYKKYIDPREYLYKTHDKPLGLPVYENESLNIMVLTSRRQGKSMWLVAILSHIFKFHGAIRFDEEYFNLKRGPAIVIGSVLGKSADTLKHFSFLEEYHKNNFGAWGEDDNFIPGWFYQQVSGSLTTSNQKSPYRNEYIEKVNGVDIKKGKGTRLVHVTYEDNPEASVGQGPLASIIEEVGLVTNLLKILGANEPGLKRNNKFGSHLCIGTAGNMEKIHDTKTVFENPEQYLFLGFPDLWEGRKKPIGLFIPGYYVDNSFRDENGNQDLEAAFEEEMRIRADKAKADNNYALDAYMMDRPIVPSEMFLSGQLNIFPISKLREQLTYVEIRDVFKTLSYTGELKWNKDKSDVIFEVDLQNRLIPIISLNRDQYKNNLKGAVVFYEAPEPNIPNPDQNSSLYKIGYDPVRDDGDGPSLASIIVYKGVSENNWATGLSDDIVAEYIGRMDRVEDVHELCVQLAIMYNAKIMVETNIPDFVRYCKREGYAHLLQAKPYKAISDSIKNPGKKYDVGIDMTSPALHEQSEQLIRQWLLTEWKEENGVKLLNLNKLKSPMILQQLIAYTRENKTKLDHITSLKLIMLWIKQTKEVPIKQSSELAKETINDFYNQLTTKRNTLLTKQYYKY
jgi:hypothetical protein